VEVIPVVDILVEVIPVEENLVAADLANPVVVQLVSVEENPVYNLVPIISKMKDDKKDRIEDHGYVPQSKLWKQVPQQAAGY
jgi:hypothetical protein